jgi:hypothetical protein
MIKNVRNNKRNKRGNNNNIRAIDRTVSLMSQPVVRRVNTQLLCSAVQNIASGFTGYSFLTNSSQSSSTFNVELLSLIYNTPEFLKMKENYNFFKINDIMLKVSPTSNFSSTALSAVSPVFYKLTAGGLPFDTTSTAYADDAIEMNNSGQPKSCIYSLPPFVMGGSGYVVGGSQLWVSTISPPTTAGLNLILGYIRAPFFTNTNATFEVIHAIDVSFNIQFACPNLYGA